MPLPPAYLLPYLRVAVVTFGEVSVVGGDDRVLLPLLLRAVPLSDARAASVGQDGRTGVLKGRREPIAGNRRTDLTRKQKRIKPTSAPHSLERGGGGAGFNRADNPRRTHIGNSIIVLQVALLVEEKENALAREGEAPGGHDRHHCPRRPRPSLPPPQPPPTRNKRRSFDEPTSRQRRRSTSAHQL